MNNSSDLTEIACFLRSANKSTYANAAAPKVASTRQGSKDYHFEQPPLVYHDTYFGGRKFIGSEVIYKDGTPVWGMNYYGRGLDEKFNEEFFDKCLRPALMQDDPTIIPVRGPAKFVSGDYVYRFSVDGTLAAFSGVEEISLSNKPIFRCLVHGGLILK